MEKLAPNLLPDPELYQVQSSYDFLTLLKLKNSPIVLIWGVHVVLYPHGIALTTLKLDSWSPGAIFFSYYNHPVNKSSDKERKIVRNKLNFMHKKDLICF